LSQRANEAFKNMSSKKEKLRLTIALGVLGISALGISCRGFFQNPTLTTITISPTAPQVQVGGVQGLTLFGNFNDGSSAQVNSGVTWSSSDAGVASFSSPSSNLLHGNSLGTATITANAQAVSATATATVFLGNITAFKVTPTTNSLTGSNTATYTFSVTSNGSQVDITTDNGGTLTVTPSTTDVTCAASGSTEVCTGSGTETTTETFSLAMSYPGTSLTATATLMVSP
jgi:trimeric autotransporter adhesin